MIKVLQQGLHVSIQDLGRIGFRNFGVPVSGAMDTISAGFANALLNNNKNDAVLEITLIGPTLAFKLDTFIAITGAEMNANINNVLISNYKIYKVQNGDILSFGKCIKGARSYLSVLGGFNEPTILQSKSYYAGITKNGIISKNQEIPFNESKKLDINHKSAVNNKNQFYETNILEVSIGPEFDLFSTKEQQKLLSSNYTVSNQNNRMGYRLNEAILPHKYSIITSPVLPGTVQLTPFGQPIILMKDAQTTGGYPRIFQLTEKSIAILAQKKSGDFIQFKLINI